MQQLLKLKRIVLEINGFASKNQVFLANLLKYITRFVSHQCKKVNGGFTEGESFGEASSQGLTLSWIP